MVICCGGIWGSCFLESAFWVDVLDFRREDLEPRSGAVLSLWTALGMGGRLPDGGIGKNHSALGEETSANLLEVGSGIFDGPPTLWREVWASD